MILLISKKEDEAPSTKYWRYLLNIAIPIFMFLAVLVYVLIVALVGKGLEYNLCNFFQQSWQVGGGIVLLTVLSLAAASIPLLVSKAIKAEEKTDYRDTAFRLLMLMGVYVAVISILGQVLRGALS